MEPFAAEGAARWALLKVTVYQRPLLAQSGHSSIEFQCPLLGVKRTSAGINGMSAFDPKRT
jgi:hypothetical protein